MKLYLSRAVLNRSASSRALLPLLDPENRARAMDAHHRLMWVLFGSGDLGAKRDFLWRADGSGRFYILSRRRPKADGLFEQPMDIKLFEPMLAVGDLLAFKLRANATKDRSRKNGKGNRRVDLVMDRLRNIAVAGGENELGKPKRADARFKIAGEVGREWLDTQGASKGFTVKEFALDDYSVVKIRHGKRIATFGILDMTGVIRITDPRVFLDALAKGFGRAKGFGCGLMLIRRA